jgi:hypothetical protein
MFQVKVLCWLNIFQLLPVRLMLFFFFFFHNRVFGRENILHVDEICFVYLFQKGAAIENSLTFQQSLAAFKRVAAICLGPNYILGENVFWQYWI